MVTMVMPLYAWMPVVARSDLGHYRRYDTVPALGFRLYKAAKAGKGRI